MSERILRDALSHISKVAAMARFSTRRLDFIVARAKTALEGHDWSENFMPPVRNDTVRRQVRQLLLHTDNCPDARAEIIKWLIDGAVPETEHNTPAMPVGDSQ